MKNISLLKYSLFTLFLTIITISSFAQKKTITDELPPENFYVTPVGAATWDSIVSDDFQNYKIWLNGVYIVDIDTNFYQYGNNGEDLVSGETYIAEIQALYNNGLSEKVEFEWTYFPCDSFPSHMYFDSYHLEGSDDVVVLWSDFAYFSPIEEDFENGLPQGWTITTNSSIGWFFTTNGSSPYWTIPAGDGTYACTNDDVANDDGSVDYLITPIMNFSAIESVTLTFSSFYDSIYGQTGTVEVSLNGGTTWVVVHDITPNDAWINTEVDLSAFAGNAEVMVAFHSNDNGAWASGWAVDNVSIAPSKSAKDIVSIGTNVYFDNELLAFVPDPDTFYIIEDVPPGFYDYCITKVYTEDGGEHTWSSCIGETCINDAGYPWPCDPPRNLTAEDLIGDGYISTLNWEAPNSFDPIWIGYDDGVNVDAIGGPDEFFYAIKWNQYQLVDFDGMAITKVKFFPRESGSFTLKIWKGSDGNTLIYEQLLSDLSYDEWNYIDLDTPVAIDITEELWVGFYVVTSGYSAGCGAFTGSPNSDLISLDGEPWERLADLGLPYSWNLGAYVELANGKIIELPYKSNPSNSASAESIIKAGGLPMSPNAIDPTKDDNILMGYNIYRDGDQVNDELVEETIYRDTVWMGQFCYEITAVYSECGESDPSDEACVSFFDGVNDQENKLNIYPNPATNFLMIEAKSNINSIKITNYLGQVVYAIYSIESKQFQVKTSGLKAGVYFLEAETKSGIEKAKVIIQ